MGNRNGPSLNGPRVGPWGSRRAFSLFGLVPCACGACVYGRWCGVSSGCGSIWRFGGGPPFVAGGRPFRALPIVNKVEGAWWGQREALALPQNTSK
eukprot:scaffold12131_cov112-Isochrysis_galbana.AAC.4